MARGRTAGMLLGLSVLAPLFGGCALVPFGQASLSERECMTRVMYFESNRSSEDGMLAVGTTVMNRIDSGRYPKTVCGVVGQPNQFADGALSKPMNPREAERVAQVADRVMAGERHAQVGGAMFFHTAGLTFPYTNMHYTAVAGGNAFYEKRSFAQRSLPTEQFAKTETPASAPFVAAWTKQPRSIDDILARSTYPDRPRRRLASASWLSSGSARD